MLYILTSIWVMRTSNPGQKMRQKNVLGASTQTLVEGFIPSKKRFHSYLSVLSTLKRTFLTTKVNKRLPQKITIFITGEPIGCQLIGLPERTQDDTELFTMFIITDMIQVRTITAEISTEFYVQWMTNIELYLHWIIV